MRVGSDGCDLGREMFVEGSDRVCEVQKKPTVRGRPRPGCAGDLGDSVEMGGLGRDALIIANDGTSVR
jgi:hypothetical protein